MQHTRSILIPRTQIVVQQSYSLAIIWNNLVRIVSSIWSKQETGTPSKTASQKPSVLAVSNGITPYGTHFLRRVAEELPEFSLHTLYSYEFSTGHWQITMPPAINAVILGKGEESFAATRGFAAIGRDWSKGLELIRQIRSRQPIVVFILGYGSLAHMMVLEWCHRKNIPCLLSGDSNIKGDRHSGMKARIKKIVVSYAVSRCTALLPCGNLGGLFFKRYGARPEQIFLSPFEPDYSLIEHVSSHIRDSLRTEFHLDAGRHRFLYSGRLVAVKRIDLLIDAFARMADQRPNWDLVIAGGGPLDAELKERLPARLQERVVWTGFIGSPERMSAMFRLADVLVLPSEYEPWGVVVNEAACAGLALICSDVVGAAAELLRDGENGRSFHLGDLQSLIDALLDVSNEANLSRYQVSSPLVLSAWRKAADPVEGFRHAMEYSLQKCASPRNPQNQEEK